MHYVNRLADGSYQPGKSATSWYRREGWLGVPIDQARVFSTRSTARNSQRALGYECDIVEVLLSPVTPR